MIIRHLYILLFLFVLSASSAQSSYSDKELKDFVDVYMTFKTEKKRSTEIDNQLFNDHNVSRLRYHEISRLALANEELELKPNEKNLIKALDEKNKFLQTENNKLLQAKCQNSEIQYQTYLAILDDYKKDIQFQRSLKPYFTEYINKLK